MNQAQKDLRYIQVLAAAGDIAGLEEVAAIESGFPAGRGEWPVEDWTGILAACGTPDVLRWALANGAPVDPEVSDGYPPLHVVLDAAIPWRLENLAILIAAGADVNRRGINDWTPLHLAAIRDDRAAMRMLLEAGADPSVRTRIDNCATPEEEARLLGHHASADFVRDHAREPS